MWSESGLQHPNSARLSQDCQDWRAAGDDPKCRAVCRLLREGLPRRLCCRALICDFFSISLLIRLISQAKTFCFNRTQSKIIKKCANRCALAIYTPPLFCSPQPLVHRTLQITRPVEKTADERMATYAMSSSLISHNEVHSVAENACHSVRALEVVALYELISRVELSPDVRLHFAVLLICDLCCVVFNAFGWQKWSPEADNESKLEHVTHVQCLVASLVNHNCNCISTPWEFTAAGMITFFANR